ncbi:MAG TPA: hypothetical protein VEK07_14220 [Polyangiaceae bacterium]|nr:hypothetical protein [Polyangiaceae bacterium]
MCTIDGTHGADQPGSSVAETDLVLALPLRVAHVFLRSRGLQNVEEPGMQPLLLAR